MLKIGKFTCENSLNGCVTDQRNPHFSFSIESDRNSVSLKEAKLSVNGWEVLVDNQISIPYEGDLLEPCTTYKAKLSVIDDQGEIAQEVICFETGLLDTPWKGKWISDATYHFTEKKTSPKPMLFQKKFSAKKKVASARIYGTAMGIYELMLNNEKVGDAFFAPGFTSYKTQLMYQTYDITNLIQNDNNLMVVVGGGWAVGAFVFTRKNRVSADRQALLLEIHLTYEDGTKEIIGTDESWQVTEDSPYREGDFYDGETYDSTIDIKSLSMKQATIEKLRINPTIIADYGAPVRGHEWLYPQSCTKYQNELVYDFGQNFAGVVCLEIKGKKGQVVTVKHAEILHPDGSINTTFLRTAKAKLVYTCSDGNQVYTPKLTYMGFRYISITGIEEACIKVSARALYSDMPVIGEFTCSNDALNRLQSNILWSAKSNFVDIPTDCPQRDERMGWTGDIALFSETACFNFDMSRFLNKWLLDVRAEQRPSGGIPNTVPAQGYGFPATMPVMAVDFWGDACVLVPWAEYNARGDINVLKCFYPMMKKYVDACRFWAGLFSFGQRRYIWYTPHSLHFGDWVAPDIPKMSQWQKRSKWTATASLKNTSGLLGKIAGILGEKEDEYKYSQFSDKVSKAYRDILTQGNGKLNEEFQTAYVLPIVFDIFSEVEKKEATKNLVRLVEESNYCIGTGFPGTPYILFALADNGYEDVAYKMLLNTASPSWLYQVKMGATTIWERWDGLDENGNCPIGDDGTDIMISYNHYASGAVGNFFYQRIAGIQPLQAGYKVFKIAPVLGGNITYAMGSVETPYGRISTDWRIEDHIFHIKVIVPIGTTCELYLPDGKYHRLLNGSHTFKASI